ncbi:MAG: protein phosphatase 2C domain-containing protein [Tannerellaceae bacterium]|jgi:serine/threonine protein phosphatase PrpC|nr:protein phosphatase 2C domain-containing protein [Tannerellaceae bacterium]
MNDSWNELWSDIADKLRVEPERLAALSDADKETIVDDFLSSNKDEIIADIMNLWEEYLDKVAPAQSSDTEEPDVDPPAPDSIQLKPQPEAVPETVPVIKQQSPPDIPTLPMQTPITGELMLRDKQLILPNGKVSQPYLVDCDAIRLQTNISDIHFLDLEKVGLKYDRPTRRITGIPQAAGEFTVVMRYRKPNKQDYSSRKITLIINPDPRSLWNPIDTPRSIEYYKEDSDKLFVAVEAEAEAKKDMAAASRRGRSHAQEGRPRDDDFALHYEDGWYIMVVADGAGSARYSRKGSEIACRKIVENCREQLALSREEFERAITAVHEEASDAANKAAGDILYSILGAAAFKAVAAIKEEAQLKGAALKDYATTLLAAICRKFSFGWFVGSFWVGDGGMGIYCRETNYLKVLGEPDGGEFAGQTRFLTMPEIIEPKELYNRLRIHIVPDFTALILMTDGVTDPKFETDANLKRIEKWHALWDDLAGKNDDGARVDFTDNNRESAPQLLRWLDFWSRGNHDDRTIAILF